MFILLLNCFENRQPKTLVSPVQANYFNSSPLNSNVDNSKVFRSKKSAAFSLKNRDILVNYLREINPNISESDLIFLFDENAQASLDALLYDLYNLEELSKELKQVLELKAILKDKKLLNKKYKLEKKFALQQYVNYSSFMPMQIYNGILALATKKEIADELRIILKDDPLFKSGSDINRYIEGFLDSIALTLNLRSNASPYPNLIQFLYNINAINKKYYTQLKYLLNRIMASKNKDLILFTVQSLAQATFICENGFNEMVRSLQQYTDNLLGEEKNDFTLQSYLETKLAKFINAKTLLLYNLVAETDIQSFPKHSINGRGTNALLGRESAQFYAEFYYLIEKEFELPTQGIPNPEIFNAYNKSDLLLAARKINSSMDIYNLFDFFEEVDLSELPSYEAELNSYIQSEPEGFQILGLAGLKEKLIIFMQLKGMISIK